MVSDDGLFVFLAKGAQAENISLKAPLAQHQYKTDSSLTAAVIRAGTGHGFIVQGADNRPYVITAGNCLPFLPVPRITFEPDERNYRSLVGTRDQDWRVSANCLLMNPIANIAVFGAPDGVEYEQERRRFRLLTAAATAMSIAAPREEEEGLGWIPSLDGRWFRCNVCPIGNHLALAEHVEQIVAEMAGMPIVAEDGSAIGVISATSHPENNYTYGFHTRLAAVLPGWLLSKNAIPPGPSTS